MGSSMFAQLWMVDPLEAIYPDVNDMQNYESKYSADFASGSSASVHILVKVPSGSTLTCSAEKDNQKLGVEVWNQLIDVPVEQNTGLDSRTEQYKNIVNPHVLRRAPFRVFEVIQPLEKNQVTTSSEFTALRLTIPKNLFRREGSHQIKIKVTSDGFEEVGVFDVNVYAVSLTHLSDSNFFYTNWFNLKRMEESHNLERWSEAWYTMLNQYAKLMAHGRQNSITIPGELIQYDSNEFSLDEDKMLRFINVFRKYQFRYFESPHLLYRGDNDDWGDPELKVILTKNGYYKDQGKEDIDKIMNLIHQFVTKNNLTQNWLQHISDEPTSANAQCYKDVVKQVKEIYPQIQIMEATNDRDGLAGAVDIWCPLINDFQENESFFREREALGEKVLVYTCLIPGGPWLNRTLDMERLRQVYFGWGAARYETQGYLHWGLNQYKADPFEQSVIPHPSPAASANNFLPAGDTHVVYPGEKGPLSSVRFEAHRIGIEDYDLLQKLKDRNLKKYKAYIAKLFTNYTDYNLSLKDYRKTKKKLLSAIN